MYYYSLAILQAFEVQTEQSVSMGGKVVIEDGRTGQIA